MKISCELVKDLLPLYMDGVCSNESRKIVEEHFAECDACKAEFQAMKNEFSFKCKDQNLREAEVVKNISKKLNRSVSKAFLKGMVIAVCVFTIVCAGNYGLCKLNIINADDSVVDTSVFSIKDDPNNLAVILDTTDGYLNGTIVSETDEKGNVYISIVRPVIKEKNGRNDNLRIIYDVSIEDKNSVYYGTPKDNILLWQKGSEISEITYEELAQMHYEAEVYDDK